MSRHRHADQKKTRQSLFRRRRRRFNRGLRKSVEDIRIGMILAVKEKSKKTRKTSIRTNRVKTPQPRIQPLYSSGDGSLLDLYEGVTEILQAWYGRSALGESLSKRTKQELWSWILAVPPRKIAAGVDNSC